MAFLYPLITVVWQLAFCRITSGDIGTFWHITDFHVDFTYDKGGAGISCDPDIPVAKRGKWGNYNCDANMEMCEEAVKAMQTFKPKADFILWTGDTTVHDSNKKFLTVEKHKESLSNVTSFFNRYHPDVKVYPALGNHDVIPTHQFPLGNSYIYNYTWGLWKRWISADQEVNFLKGGYYRIDRPRSSLTLLVLNSNLWSVLNPLTKESDDPSNQFHWMAQQMADIKAKKRKVLLVAHIGPGYRVDQRKFEFYSKHEKQLLAILTLYSESIVGVYVGHIHIDTFKVLYDETGRKPLVPILFALSVTPRFQRNPGVRLVKYNRTTTAPLDYTQYYFNLPKSNVNGTTKWNEYYTVSNKFGLNDLSATSLAALADKVKDDTSMIDTMRKIRVGRPDFNEDCDSKCRKTLYCSMTRVHQNQFNECVKSYTTTLSTSPVYCVLLAIALFISHISSN